MVEASPSMPLFKCNIKCNVRQEEHEEKDNVFKYCTFHLFVEHDYAQSVYRL